MERKRKADKDDIFTPKRAKRLDTVTILDDDTPTAIDISPVKDFCSRFDAAVTVSSEVVVIQSDDEDNELLPAVSLSDDKTEDVISIDSDDEDNELLATVSLSDDKTEEVISIDSDDEDNELLAAIDFPPKCKSTFTFKTPSKYLIHYNSNNVLVSAPIAADSPPKPKGRFTFKTPSKQLIQYNTKSNVSVPAPIDLPCCSKTLSPSSSVPQSVPDWTNDGWDEQMARIEPVIPEARASHFQHHDIQDSLQRVLKEKFKLSTFRPMQREIISATLAGNNCLVILPTSGGKSLCFQLPAVMHKGVTIVVSPLKSLMLDQVSKLNGLGIYAVCMGENSNLVQVYRDLSSANPLIKVLYTTPEMLCINARFRNQLQDLHKKGKLARFVFDEAHCITEGTSDFRPQYKKLHFLGNSFQSVPFMALTATGSPRILTDIKNCLGIQNWISFKSSVDRPNLKYIVNVKRNACLDDCIDLISNTFRGSSGIIYCFTQSDCDKTATKLKQVGISAAAYHAGLTAHLRNSRQTSWTNNAIQVMVATVAFGMGIDKPDVRFVIHLTIPKSIEGYYQECGRAGRDGKNSTCILFYRFSDSFQLMSLAEPKKATCMEKFLEKNDKEVKDKIDSLLSMVKFCEDRCTCRRTMLLNYFGDDLNSKCNGQLCDNCESNCTYSSVDVTSFAQAVVQWIGQLPKGSKPVCFGSLVEILKGSKCKRVLDDKYECVYIYGLLKSWKKNSVERFVQKLIIDKLLFLRFITNSVGFKNAFIAEGDRSILVKQDDFALSLALPTEKDSSIVRDNDSEDELSDDFETDN